MKLQPEVWAIISAVVSSILTWIGKGKWGRYVESAKTKKFLQNEIDQLYLKINELMKEQLQSREKLNDVILKLTETKLELIKATEQLEQSRKTIQEMKERINELELHQKK